MIFSDFSQHSLTSFLIRKEGGSKSLSKVVWNGSSTPGKISEKLKINLNISINMAMTQELLPGLRNGPQILISQPNSC
jgi:hypothetical protein